MMQTDDDVNLDVDVYDNDVYLGFEAFCKLFSRTLDKHAPYKELRKKNVIEILKLSITKGIPNTTI